MRGIKLECAGGTTGQEEDALGGLEALEPVAAVFDNCQSA